MNGQGTLGAKIAGSSGNPDHLEIFYDFAHRRGTLDRKTREHLIGTVAANSPKAAQFLEKMQLDYQAIYGTSFGPRLKPTPYEIPWEEERSHRQRGTTWDDDVNSRPGEPEAPEPEPFVPSPGLRERFEVPPAPEEAPPAPDGSLDDDPEELRRRGRIAALREAALRSGAFDDRMAYVLAALEDPA